MRAYTRLVALLVVSVCVDTVRLIIVYFCLCSPVCACMVSICDAQQLKLCYITSSEILLGLV